MTKIKIGSALLALLLMATTKLPAPPSGGATCAQVTSGWACSVSQPQGNVWLFSVSGSQIAYVKVYLNGQLYGQTMGSFYLPTYLHGSWRVEAYASIGGCIRDLGTFSL